MKNNKPKILVYDVETAPILGFVWGLWENNVALNQIHSDWHLLSYSAKWYQDTNGTVYGPHNKVMYNDQSKVKNIENDKKLLEELWNLLNEADIVISQNGVAFDNKKVNARFLLNGMTPPSPYKNIDTLKIMKKYFALTSNKLEYASNNLCTKFKKLKTKKFQGFELWKACLSGNKEAWAEMKLYNMRDVTSLQELFHKLQPWDNSINFNLYTHDILNACNCGSSKLQRRGYSYTTTGKFQRWQCLDCGSWSRDKTNMYSKEKAKSLKTKA